MGSKAAFFYGTLLHPMVLKRVIGNDGQHLMICPAILPEHTRHQIKNADYPGVVPYALSKNLFNRKLSNDERSVRGNVVVGLSDKDVEFLDLFEGDEYSREYVKVYKLGPMEPLNSPSESIISTKAGNFPGISNLEPIDAAIYIWSAPTHHLIPELWSYDVFMRDNAWKWVGSAEAKEEYAEVDRRRQMNGTIERSFVDALEQYASI